MPDQLLISSTKSSDDIIKEWNNIAPERDSEIESGRDRTMVEVLVPRLVRHTGNSARILDVGCGSGYASRHLAASGASVVGIDPSEASIRLAKKHDPTGEYIVATLQDWVEHPHSASFDTIVANMVIMDVVDLRGFAQALGIAASSGTNVILTMTHPCFWPVYWDYLNHPEFDYNKECFIETRFATSSKVYEHRTTHVHRPLSRYLDELRTAGLDVQRIEEFAGSVTTRDVPYPRFIEIHALGT